MTVMNYDPNLVNSGKCATQRVKLVFGQWEYRAELFVNVGGNCRGLSVIDTAVDMAYEGLPGTEALAHIILTRADGETLHCEDDEGNGVDWLEDMLISAEIVSIEPEKQDT